jgi:ketosteroid isomerase-like protein
MILNTLLTLGLCANFSFGVPIANDKAGSLSSVQAIGGFSFEGTSTKDTTHSSSLVERGGGGSVLNVMADLMAGGEQSSYTDQNFGAETIMAFIAAYNTQDAQAAANLTTDDFIRYSSTTSKPMNKNDWIQMWVGFDRAFPDETWDLKSLKVSGNKITIDVVETGTFKEKWTLNDGHVIAPTGKGYTNNSTIEFSMNEKGKKIKSYQQKTGNGFLAVGIEMSDLIAIGKNGF